ncbi:MAG: threonine/serine exporter family protein [Clostridia bacterium]|nr:threonine/serine exporter family protein [Clostridia bacterium]
MPEFLEILKLLISAMLGSFAFSIFFCMSPKRFVPAMLGGLLAGGTYILLISATGQEFLSNMLAAIVATVYCEVCARVTRAPAVIYIIPALFPLVPGGALYYTINALVSGQYTEALGFGKQTLEIALGISCGFILTTFVDASVKRARKRRISGVTNA